MTIDLKPGDKAPDFDLPSDSGRVSLAALKGKTVVLYFYPKDDTPGCTNEAKDFSALAAEFAKAGATVVGVSKDTAAKHGKFRAKHDLKVELGSDAESDVIERYGAWVEKKLYGREYMGIDRSTWLIDGDGVIRRVWRKVRRSRTSETLPCDGMTPRFGHANDPSVTVANSSRALTNIVRNSRKTAQTLASLSQFG
ncbi:MAG: peroxiredoxin [Caulobacter sp.]|nr:peroxiredoxin [Caulobacter sp.]